MSSSRLQDITKWAKKLRRSVNAEVKNVNCNMDTVVAKLGGQLVYGATGDKILCAIVKTDTGFAIDLNHVSDPKEKNFEIAVQLAHLFIHFGYNTDLWDEYPLGYVSPRQGIGWSSGEAARFASEFLMPKKEYLNLYNLYKRGYSDYFKGIGLELNDLTKRIIRDTIFQEISKVLEVPVWRVAIRRDEIRLQGVNKIL